jgi:uncharacterized membrane protein
VSDDDIHGPIDYVLLEFQADQLRGEVAAAVLDLVDAGLVQIDDLVIIAKDDDGTVSGIALDALSEEFAAFEGVNSGLLGDEDIQEAASAMQPGTLAALLVYENVWARPFVGAVYRAGGEVIASGRIPADVVNEALDALEA